MRKNNGERQNVLEISGVVFGEVGYGGQNTFIK